MRGVGRGDSSPRLRSSSGRFAAMLVVAGLGATLVPAGCGGASSAGQPSTAAPLTLASTPAATPAASDLAAAGSTAAQVRAAWATFFDGKTSATKKIALLQDGSAVAAAINAQAGNALSTSTTATVSSVTVTSPHRAAVRYTIDLGGKPALSNQKGVAVQVAGHWLVGLSSFCGLLSLEGSHPAACASTGGATG